EQTENMVEEGGLAAAVGSEDDDPLPLLDYEVEAAQIDLGLVRKDVPHAGYVHHRIGRAGSRVRAPGMAWREAFAHRAPPAPTARITIRTASVTGTQSKPVPDAQWRHPHTRPEWPRRAITAYTRWLLSAEKRTSVPSPCPILDRACRGPRFPH